MLFKEFLESAVSTDISDIQGWLGKSTIKVPVYHGTNKVFKDFQLMPTKRYVLFSEFDVASQGFFFSESKETAAEYGRNIMTCYVRLTNPLLDPRQFPHMGVDKFPDAMEARLAYILRNALDKDKMLEIGVGARAVPKLKQDVEMRTRMGDRSSRMIHNDYSWIYYAIGRGGLAWDMLDMPKVVQSMKRFGYDGTYVDEDHDSSGRSVFVMSPDQIKLVSVDRVR